VRANWILESKCVHCGTHSQSNVHFYGLFAPEGAGFTAPYAIPHKQKTVIFGIKDAELRCITPTPLPLFLTWSENEQFMRDIHQMVLRIYLFKIISSSGRSIYLRKYFEPPLDERWSNGRRRQHLVESAPAGVQGRPIESLPLCRFDEER
jgi:hypothetical protein